MASFLPRRVVAVAGFAAVVLAVSAGPATATDPPPHEKILEWALLSSQFLEVSERIGTAADGAEGCEFLHDDGRHEQDWAWVAAGPTVVANVFTTDGCTEISVIRLVDGVRNARAEECRRPLRVVRSKGPIPSCW